MATNILTKMPNMVRPLHYTNAKMMNQLGNGDRLKTHENAANKHIT